MLLVISILVSVGVCAGFPGYPKRYFAINNSSAEAVGIAQSALFLQNTKAMTQWKLYSVLSVEKQVLYGSRYVVEARIATSYSYSKIYLCKFGVDVTSTGLGMALKTHSCVNNNVTWDRKVLNSLFFAVDDYNKNSNNKYRFVAEGSSNLYIKDTFEYGFTLNMVESKCLNTRRNMGKGVLECYTKYFGKRFSCEVKVLYQPLEIHHYKMIESCMDTSW